MEVEEKNKAILINPNSDKSDREVLREMLNLLDNVDNLSQEKIKQQEQEYLRGFSYDGDFKGMVEQYRLQINQLSIEEQTKHFQQNETIVPRGWTNTDFDVGGEVVKEFEESKHFLDSGMLGKTKYSAYVEFDKEGNRTLTIEQQHGEREPIETKFAWEDIKHVSLKELYERTLQPLQEDYITPDIKKEWDRITEGKEFIEGDLGKIDDVQKQTKKPLTLDTNVEMLFLSLMTGIAHAIASGVADGIKERIDEHKNKPHVHIPKIPEEDRLKIEGSNIIVPLHIFERISSEEGLFNYMKAIREDLKDKLHKNNPLSNMERNHAEVALKFLDDVFVQREKGDKLSIHQLMTAKIIENGSAHENQFTTYLYDKKAESYIKLLKEKEASKNTSTKPKEKDKDSRGERTLYD